MGISEQHRSWVAHALPGFLAEHRLPVTFRRTAETFYLPLAGQLPRWRRGTKTLLLGINGAQGTGKSTLAAFLATAAAGLHGWRPAVLSIDDFYLTRSEREALAENVHPLFATRGVPGTHDTALMTRTLERLEALRGGEPMSLPRFDKANDDRAAESDWPVVAGPLDVIVLEGWCVGSRAQPEAALSDPVNELERDEDPDGTWRNYANAALAESYEPVFSRLDALAFLAAPSFDAVFRWRLEQERKLAEQSAGSALMDEYAVARFVRFFERITRDNLARLPARADVVLSIDESHAVTTADYRGR